MAPSAADVQGRINALAGAKTPNAHHARLLTLYRQTLSDLKAAHADQQQAREYAETGAQAPAKIKAIKKKIAALPAQVTLHGRAHTSLSRLDSRLAKAQAKLTSLQSRLTDLQAQEGVSHVISLQQSLARLKSTLEQLPASPQAAPSASAELQSAQRDALAAKRLALQAHIQMLRQRLASRDDRLRLITAESELTSRRLELSKSRVNALQALSNKRHQRGAHQAVQTAESIRVHLRDQPEIVQHYAQQNAALTHRRIGLERAIAAVIQDKNSIQSRLDKLSRIYNTLIQQLQISGLAGSAELGALLRQQRDKLAETELDTRVLKHHRGTLTTARLEQFRIEQRQNIAAEPTIKNLLAKAERTADSKTGAMLKHLIDNRQRILQNLANTYTRYVSALAELDAEEKTLINKTQRYKRLLNERLFWIPSAPPVSWSTWSNLKRAISWLLQPEHWQRTANTLGARVIPRPLLIALAGLVFILLLRRRRHFKRVLADMQVQIGRVGRDRFSLTLQALLITFLLALPGPLLLSFIGGSFRYSGTFADVLATGILNAAAIYFLFGFFYHVCGANGLGEVHFKWSERAVRVMRSNLPWLTLVLVPITVVTAFTEGPIIAAYRNSLGRLVFVVASVALAIFAHNVFQPQRGALSHMISKNTGPWRWQLRHLVYPAAVMIPLVLMGLALYGYHYTALQLEGRFFVSACVIVAGVLVFYLIVRALAVTERRIALRRLRARRAAARAYSESREAAESSGEGVPGSLDVPQVDLDAISEQSRALLRLLTTLGIGACLWLVWANIFPALGILNDITLWHAGAAANGTNTLGTITLQDLILAMLAAFLTFVAARNLPGTLQAAVLGRLSMAPGTSYAIMTLCRYTIVIIGSVAAFKLLGVQWAKLQWLVAALGVGLGFGLQEIVANFVSGILILFERPMRVGDTVTIGGQTGTVTRIRIRATTVTDWDLKEQIIPNKTFITGDLTNWTLSDPTTRLIIKVGVAYGSDIELVHQLLRDIAEKNPVVAETPSPSVFFVGFGESSLNFEVRVFVESLRDFMPLTHELNTTICATLERHGITIPFPQRDVHVHPARSAGPRVEDAEAQRKRA